MNIGYNPQAPRGKQFDIMLADGRTVQGVSRDFCDAILRQRGVSVRDAAALVAQAKLEALAPCIS